MVEMNLLKNRSRSDLLYLIIVALSIRYLYRSWNKGELFMKGASVNKIDDPAAFYILFAIFSFAILYLLWGVIGSDIKTILKKIKGRK
jgi:hypothetical protein